MYARARQSGTQGFSIFIDPGRDVKVSYLCLGDTFYARPGNCGPQGIELLEVWHSTSCWRCCESRGFLSYAPGSESAHMFHLSHFHRLVSFCWFGFGCWGGFVCFAFAFFLSTDQSVRSSCQPMTSLAYFHDCHCRYDERSIAGTLWKRWTPYF